MMPDPSPLSGMNPTGRFSDRAADYVKYRPDYPAAAFDAMLDGLAAPAQLGAADVGAGTGISSRQLAERGVTVAAVEPNAAMRAAAEPHRRVTWHDGTAEATGLDAASADLVLCAQAFHWFRPPQALAEFRRVLREHGRLALMWNVRDDSDPLTRSYIDAIHAVNGAHPAEVRELDPGVFAAGGPFAVPRLATFEHRQWLDLDGFLGRAASASYVSKEPAAFAALTRLLTDIHAQHCDTAGRVCMLYLTDVYLTEAA